MASKFDVAFARVKQLVADFRANEKFYLSPAYQEQEARRDFIDKFWLALGWDVNHETQKNPFEQEVKVERGLSLSASTGERDGVRCRNSQRRADYAFYLAPNFRDVKFYVEAKKPHGDIATADNYFQTIRYPPVTDFERATSYCPLYLAWRILDEARDYFRTSWVPSPGSASLSHQMGEGLANKLAHRAEAVFAKHALSSAKWRRGNGRGGASSKPLSPALSPFDGARKRPFWRRKFQGRFRRSQTAATGRDAILTSMRHWLAGVLAKERPALFRDLPENFKVGHPLPEKAPHPGPLPRAERGNHRPRFVHGCELLPV
jgi:hypothetical protein